MRISIRVCAYIYTRTCVLVYAYVGIKMRNLYTHMHIHVCLLVFMSWLIVFLLLAALECVQTNLLLVHRISAESTKKPVCEQRSEYEPTRDVSFKACTIDKQVFLRNFPFIIHTHKINSTRPF